MIDRDRDRTVGMGAGKLNALRAIRVDGLPRFRAVPAIDGATPNDECNCKTLYLIRHGQAAHNVQERPWGAELIDAQLTSEGRRQAVQLRSRSEHLPLEAVIVSPLSRAIETALLGLTTHRERGIPFVASEDCREQFGANLPDQRPATAELRRQFGAVDFEGLAATDVLFTPEREPLEALAARANRFLDYLMKRPEQHLGVVTHSSFLAALCNVALDTSGSPGLREWFDNAELRVARVTCC